MSSHYIKLSNQTLSDKLIRLLLTRECTLIIPFKNGEKTVIVAYKARSTRVLKFSGTPTYIPEEGERIALADLREEFKNNAKLIYDEGKVRFENVDMVTNIQL